MKLNTVALDEINGLSEDTQRYLSEGLGTASRNAVRAAVMLLWDEGALQGEALAKAIALGDEDVTPEMLLLAALGIDKAAFVAAGQQAIAEYEAAHAEDEDEDGSQGR